MKKTHVMTGLAVALGLGVSSYALANEENMKVIASVEDALKNSKKGRRSDHLKKDT